MNDQSSRSHSLFTVYLEIEENGKIRSGKLNLVDLAGSERVGKTNATGQTFDEGKKINLSLTALGSVIDALSFNRKHIPYKDSKLTRLLADSLGGNTKTVMFANVSPASYNYDETLGTLRYASRAKLIKNAPKINEDPIDAELRKLEAEIKALKEQMANGAPVGEGRKIKKKKKKIKKEKSNLNNDDSNDNEDDGDDDNSDDEEDGDEYNDFALVMDDPEKKKLTEKLADLEKNLLDNKKLEISENENGDKEELKKKIKEQEEENRKFREYREQQLKQNEEMEEKLKKLEEEKRKEEESLKKDANKLQDKIKQLNSEIEDLKLDNSKDRTDYMEGVRAIYRNNQFYREILRYMLSDSELKQIIDMSKYVEDEDKWHVQTFSLQEKTLALPTVKLGQIGGGRFSDLKNGGNKQIIFQNYGDENNNNDDYNNNDNYNNNDEYEENDHNDLKSSKSNKKLKEINRYDDQINNRINFRMSKEKFFVDGKRQAKSQAPSVRNIAGTQKSFYNKNVAPNEETNNINRILMTKKEREKFEGLSNGGIGNQQLLNPMFVSASKSNQIYPKTNKLGKLVLNPLENNNTNKFEVSIKATVEINNRMPPIIGNKKINLAHIGDKEDYD